MKIRTKIIGISSVAVLAATLLVSGIIWKILGKSQEEAVMQAYQSCYFFVNDFEEALEKSGTDAIGLEYFLKCLNMKTMKDKRTIIYVFGWEKK